MSADNIGLIHEFTYSMTASHAHDVGVGPLGHRQYFEVTSGIFEGPRLSGKLLGPGIDWMLIGSDGYMRMDVRIQIETGDGAIICAHYFGPAEANNALKEAFGTSEPTRFADQRIRTHWLLETGDPRYAWVNQSVFVGEGRYRPGDSGSAGFEHRVHRVD